MPSRCALLSEARALIVISFVRPGGVEPPRGHAPLDFESSASTGSSHSRVLCDRRDSNPHGLSAPHGSEPCASTTSPRSRYLHVRSFVTLKRDRFRVR